MRLKHLIAMVLAGILLSLAWIGVSGIFLLVGWVPLLWLDDYYTRNKAGHVPIVFWSYALGTTLLWNALSVWWIGYATIVGALFAIIANAFLMSIIWLIVHNARRLVGNGLANAIMVFGWLAFEYLHYNWELSWPWLNLGNGLSNNIKLIQWYEYTGVLGGSLWVLLCNLVLWNIVRSFVYKKYTRNTLLAVVQLLVLVIVPVLSSLLIFNITKDEGEAVNVVVAQPNIDPYTDKFSGMDEIEQYRRITRVCDSVTTTGVDFFVGPETALHNMWQHNINRSKPAQMFNWFIAQKTDAAFVIGAMTYKRYSSNDEIPATARSVNDSSLIYDAFNSALLITDSGVVDMYHKSQLVAGVEKIPYENYLGFLKRLLVDLGGTTGTLATDSEAKVFEYNSTVVGVPICYESVYGQYVSTFINRGAELLFIITNDGWWKDSPGYKQHFSYARILAIQFRRDIARSGNTGISGFINKKGEVLAKTKWWTNTAIRGELNKNDKITFYARHGDYIGRISAFMILFLGLLLGVTKIKEKNNRTILLCKTPNIQDLSA